MAKATSSTKAPKECPISKEDFGEKAKDITVKVADSVLVGMVKRENKSGSFGWYATGKAVVIVDGQPITCQVGCNITVVGSKEAE